MSLYRWAMRNGSAILFVTAILVFVVHLSSQFIMRSNPSGPDLMEAGQGPSRLWFLAASIAQAISSSATIFAAACIVYWLEHRSARKDPAE